MACSLRLTLYPESQTQACLVLLQVPWPLHDCPLQKLQDVPVLHDWVLAGFVPEHRLSPTCSSAHIHWSSGKQIIDLGSHAGRAASTGFSDASVADMCTYTGSSARCERLLCWELRIHDFLKASVADWCLQ